MTSIKAGSPLPTFESFARPTSESALKNAPLRMQNPHDRILTSALADIDIYTKVLAQYKEALTKAQADLDKVENNAEILVDKNWIQDITLSGQILATLDDPRLGNEPWKVQIVVELVGADRLALAEAGAKLAEGFAKAHFGYKPYSTPVNNLVRVYIPYYL